MDDGSTEILDKAIKDRDEFLERHPHQRKFQEEIDRILDNSGSAKNRMLVLAMLIEGKLSELHQAIVDLQAALESQK
jgi:hypothetical protein